MPISELGLSEQNSKTSSLDNRNLVLTDLVAFNSRWPVNLVSLGLSPCLIIDLPLAVSKNDFSLCANASTFNNSTSPLKKLSY